MGRGVWQMVQLALTGDCRADRTIKDGGIQQVTSTGGLSAGGGWQRKGSRQLRIGFRLPGNQRLGTLYILWKRWKAVVTTVNINQAHRKISHSRLASVVDNALAMLLVSKSPEGTRAAIPFFSLSESTVT